MSVVTSYFEKVRTQVTKLAKAIANLDDRTRRLPPEFDLTISAFAKGSLVLGFSLPTTEDLDQDGQATLFGKNDPLHQAARNAMKTLGLVSHLASTDASKEKFAEAIPDAKVRDTALSAIRELAPSGRQGVSSVTIAGKEVGEAHSAKLTQETRETIQRSLEHPVALGEPIVLRGQVREIDLDAKRFELRHLENMEASQVRCVYQDQTDTVASKSINKFVQVPGMVQRDASGKARLLEIESIEIE